MKLQHVGLALFLSLGVAACVPPPQPGKQTQKQEKKSVDVRFGTTTGKDTIRLVSKGKSKDPKKVRICLRNSASGKNKGIHFKPGKPRYVVKRKGGVKCGEFPAGPKTVTWYLHRTRGLGGLKFVGTYNFNATGFAGQKVTFDWIDD